MKNIENYYDEHWLSLSEAAREDMVQRWDAQFGEGLPFAIMALARLVMSSELPIVHANIGVYHGGTHLLKVSIGKPWQGTNKDELPPLFEGFPVIWANYKNEWVGGFRMGG